MVRPKKKATWNNKSYTKQNNEIYNLGTKLHEKMERK